MHGDDAFAGAFQMINGGVVVEADALRGEQGGEAGGEQIAVAGVVVRQMQGADQTMDGVAKAGFVLQAFLRRQFAAGHAVFTQYGDVFLRAVHFFVAAKDLQRALFASFKVEVGVVALEFGKHGAAVFGDAHHAFFVGFVARGGAVAEHFQQPFELKAAAVGAQDERRMRFE